jgi:hypothetical protein
VNFGSPISDQAFLVGTANQPGDNGGTTPGVVGSQYPSINANNGQPAGGTITFTLYGPGNCTTVAAVTSGTNPYDNNNVSGDGTYNSNSVVPALPGDYHWVASYTGDDPNTLGTDHNTTCSDADEDVTIQKLQPTMDTAQNFVPNDSATVTVSGGGDLAGTATFYMWVNDATCGGGDLTSADYTSSAIDITTGSGSALSRTVVSDNAVAYDTNGTTFDWVVVYDSSNPSHFDVTSACTNEHSSISISNGVTQPAP